MPLPRNLLIALSATFVAFCTLYTPQPMLPLLALEFSVSSSEAGLLVTATMLPLGLAPVFYGYFLQAIPAKLMLSVALSLLLCVQFGFGFATEFWHLLLLRSAQGLLLPAIFTALMTYCSSMAPEGQVRKSMGWYIGATILGGFGGRLIGGYFASLFEWQSAFVMLGFLLIVPIFLLRYASADAQISFARLDFYSVTRVLKARNFRYIYLTLFCVFFVFSGILNVLPFRLTAIDASVSPLLISTLYIGYLIGMPVAIFCEPIARLFGSDKRGLLVGLLLLATGLCAFLLRDFNALLVMMFCLAAGYFLIHSTLSGLVNQRAREHKGVVNGLYVSIYYMSGALGSWLPGYFYDSLGWNRLILIFLAILCLSVWFILQLRLHLPEDPVSNELSH